MRRAVCLLLTIATILSACGTKKLELSGDPVEKAATCGVVAAADARAKAPAQGALPFEQQVDVMHYPLLAGAAHRAFSRDKASTVIKKMQDIQDKVTSGDWQKLIGLCHVAFPDADPAKTVSLPADLYETQIGCYSLANFIASALKGQGATYDDALLSFGTMQTKLDPKIALDMAKRGINSDESKKAERDRALSEAVKWGAPGKVLVMCRAKLG